MGAAELIPILIALLKDAPEMIGVVEQSYTLFAGGAITADQLAAMWTSAGTAAKAAEAKWKAAAPVAA